jgi:hypothetical protein
MKKLGLFLSALLVVSTIASSPVLASRPSFQHRVQALLAAFYQNTLPASFVGVFITPGEFEPIIDDGSGDVWVGGDADDYGNGRGAGDSPISGREAFRPVGGMLQVPDGSDARVIKKRV